MTSPLQPPLFAPEAQQTEVIPGIWLGRNWHRSSAPVWSRAPAATLNVDPGRFPDPLPLVLELSVFGASPGQPRRLTVTSPGHPDSHAVVQGPAPVRLRTMTPRAGAGMAQLSLVLDALTSPSHLGLSADDRLLGVSILSARIQPDAPDWPLEVTEAARGWLGPGWAEISAGGVWSEAPEATLTLPGYLRPQQGEALRVMADVLNRPDEDMAPLEIEVFCNGAAAARWQVPPEDPHALICPLTGWRDNTDCTLEFRMENLCSPRDLGINADLRPLGLMLRGLALEAAPEGASADPP